MELVLNDKSVSIDEIFTKHQKFYKTHLTNFDQTKIREVEKRLEDLKNKKMDIVLLRLPIHNSLLLLKIHLYLILINQCRNSLKGYKYHIDLIIQS